MSLHGCSVSDLSEWIRFLGLFLPKGMSDEYRSCSAPPQLAGCRSNGRRSRSAGNWFTVSADLRIVCLGTTVAPDVQTRSLQRFDLVSGIYMPRRHCGSRWRRL